MTEIELYLYSGCGSCRNAGACLSERGATVAKRDIFADRLSGSKLMALFERIGTAPRDMLARRSGPYRKLGLAERTLRTDEIVELMVGYPARVRRPIVVAGALSQVGFNRTAIQRLLAAMDEGAIRDA